MSGNGQLAPSELALIPGGTNVTTNGTQYLSVSALPYFLAAAAEFRERTGLKVHVAEGYRTLATQTAYFLDRYFPATTGVLWRGQRWLKKVGKATAAVPGTSIHGNGDAVDVWSGIDASFTATNHRVWVEVAAKYGWKNTGTAFGEPWHQEWSWARVTRPVADLADVTHPGSTGAPISNELEDDMFSDEDSKRLEFVFNVLTSDTINGTKGGIRGVVVDARDTAKQVQAVLTKDEDGGIRQSVKQSIAAGQSATKAGEAAQASADNLGRILAVDTNTVGTVRVPGGLRGLLQSVGLTLQKTAGATPAQSGPTLSTATDAELAAELLKRMKG